MLGLNFQKPANIGLSSHRAASNPFPFHLRYFLYKVGHFLCPPKTVTVPPGKEVGVIMMVSDLELSSIQRPDINGADTVQTGLTELTHLELIVGGVYHRNRPSQSDLKLEEMA